MLPHLLQAESKEVTDAGSWLTLEMSPFNGDIVQHICSRNIRQLENTDRPRDPD